MSSDKRSPKKPDLSCIRTYLSSVKDYIRFVYLTYPVSLLLHVQLNTLTKRVDSWWSTFWKDTEFDKYQKQLDAIDKYPTAEEFTQVDESIHMKDAKRLINSFCFKTELTKMSFTFFRDGILTILLHDNASRPQGVYNMTLREYRRRKEDSENKETYIVTTGKPSVTVSPPLKGGMKFVCLVSPGTPELCNKTYRFLSDKVFIFA